MSFANLELDSRLLRLLEKAGFELPTDVQQRAVPVVLAGRDLLASAQTGTGKTLAYVLPALHRLLQEPKVRRGAPRVLVLVPTRELAFQVIAVVRDFSRGLRVRSFALVGGTQLGPQRESLKQPVHFVAATPGRLLDLWRNRSISLADVEMLVLDEADRMLELGFIDDVEQIVSATPAERQTLLFSATLEGEVEKVARQMLRSPAHLQIAGVSVPHANITQRMFWANDGRHKRELLLRVLRDPEMKQALIFTNTRNFAQQLADELKGWGIGCDALHGQMTLPARRRVVDRLKSGDLQFLVATDVAARGLDLRGITHVINFDLPHDPENFVHRTGRTGRASDRGVAVSLILPRERGLLVAIERLTGQKLERVTIPGLEPSVDPDQRPPRKERAGAGGRKEPRFRNLKKRPEGAPAATPESAAARAPREEQPRGKANFGKEKFGPGKFGGAKHGEGKVGKAKYGEEKFGKKKGPPGAFRGKPDGAPRVEREQGEAPAAETPRPPSPAGGKIDWRARKEQAKNQKHGRYKPTTRAAGAPSKAPGKSAPGRSGPGKGTPGSGKPTSQGKPFKGKPFKGKPAKGKPGKGKPFPRKGK